MRRCTSRPWLYRDSSQLRTATPRQLPQPNSKVRNSSPGIQVQPKWTRTRCRYNRGRWIRLREKHQLLNNKHQPSNKLIWLSSISWWTKTSTKMSWVTHPPGKRKWASEMVWCRGASTQKTSNYWEKKVIKKKGINSSRKTSRYSKVIAKMSRLEALSIRITEIWTTRASKSMITKHNKTSRQSRAPFPKINCQAR